MSSEDTSTRSFGRVPGAAIEGTMISRDSERGVEDHTETIDYKMVTFSLGGKDYGIDIMNVKEIAKFHTFTYVPNAPPFVRGVYNLRGDIISIIDLRLMFNLPAEQKDDNQPEDGLIIRMENHMLGVIVDNVARVVGISRRAIQPPHPIFADINLKYISGVVEHESRLYIILDVERIFHRDGGVSERSDPGRTEPDTRPMGQFGGEFPAHATEPQPVTHSRASGDERQVDFEFVRETLATFAGFHASEVNRQWLRRRFEDWRRERESVNKDVQLASTEDAEMFLEPFYSPSTNAFWSEQYVRRFASILPAAEHPSAFTAWNIGCGKGFETYSLALTLRDALPESRLKIWANDNDLLGVSTAPNLVFSAGVVPELFRRYVVAGRNGYSFSHEIRDLIVFEYHDVTNPSAVPEMDLIVVRDVLSFMPVDDQQAVIERIGEKAKPGAIAVLGENERMPVPEIWEPIEQAPSGVYRKVE